MINYFSTSYVSYSCYLTIFYYVHHTVYVIWNFWTFFESKNPLPRNKKFTDGSPGFPIGFAAFLRWVAVSKVPGPSLAEPVLPFLGCVVSDCGVDKVKKMWQGDVFSRIDKLGAKVWRSSNAFLSASESIGILRKM